MEAKKVRRVAGRVADGVVRDLPDIVVSGVSIGIRVARASRWKVGRGNGHAQTMAHLPDVRRCQELDAELLDLAGLQ